MIKFTNLSEKEKNFIISDAGTNKWAFQTYRDENGKFAYIYNFEQDSEVFTLEETGRVGINKQSNIMSYHSDYTGTVGVGFNDLVVGGLYTGDAQVLYEIKITSINPDKFYWRKSTNYGTSWNTSSSPINVTLTPVNVELGITVQWSNLTGHTTGNIWQFYAYPQTPQGSFTVAPNLYDEILLTTNYTNIPPIYQDVSNEIQISTDKNTTVFTTGTTSAFYVGALTQFRAVFVNMKTSAVGVSLVAEYWNGTAWSGLTITDGTTGLTTTGNISFIKPSNWAKSSLTGSTNQDVEYLYWMRFRSSTSIITAPIVSSFARNGDKRLSVYSAHLDPIPTFVVNSAGNVIVGKSNGVSNKLLTITDTLNPTSTAGGNGVAINFQTGGGIYMKAENSLCEGKFESFSGIIQIGAMTIHPLALYSANLSRMYFNNASAGNKFSAALGTNVTTFDAVNPELLKLGDSGYTQVSFNLLAGYANLNNYLQLNIKNYSTGTTASSDIVATANNGSETTNYINMGINGSNFSSTGFTIYKGNDAYLYNMGQDLNIGTGDIGKIIKFHTGGFLTGNTRITIDSTGVTVAGTIISSSSIKVGDDSSSASASNVGSLRYRSDSNNSYCEMCMQTGAITYEWVVIKTNTWV